MTGMPTYEYRCTACEHLWEADQSIKDDPLTTCPSCGKESAKRLISAGNFIMKGGRSEGSSGGGGAEKPADAATQAFHDRFEQVSGIRVGDDK